MLSLRTSVAALAALSAFAFLANGRPQVGSAYQFPDAIEDILSGPIVEAFSCEGFDYGYYADIDNNCEIFHICLPIQDNDGVVIETAQWSFACGNGTVFDQQTLTCNFPTDAFPCEESASLYGAVEFGRVEE